MDYRRALQISSSADRRSLRVIFWITSIHPMNFAVCFFLASIFFALSWFALAQTREPEDTEKIIPEEKTHFWDDSKKILRKDTNFNWFLTARFLSQFATMGFSFYIIYALRDFNMDTVTAGFLTATLTISQTVANIGMGLDRRPHWSPRHAHLRRICGIAQRCPCLERHIHLMVLSHLHSHRARQRFHLDHRHGNDCGFRQRKQNVRFTLVSHKRSPPPPPSSLPCSAAGSWILPASFQHLQSQSSSRLSMIGILVFLVKDPRTHQYQLTQRSNPCPSFRKK